MTDAAASNDKSRHRQSLSYIIGFAILCRIGLELFTHRTVEDFYITLRYAENISHGLGFVFNSGERVLGTTTPLYTLYLALLDFLHLNATLLGKITNIVADGASCLLLYRLGSNLKRPRCGLVAAALFAIWPVCLYWSVSGMETSLVTFAGLWFVVSLSVTDFKRMAWSGAMLILLRIDGAVLVGLGYLGLHWHAMEAGKDRIIIARSALKSIFILMLILLPWMVFATLYFGSPVPTSIVAKLQVYGWQAKTGFPNIGPFLRHFLKPQQILAAIGAFFGLLVVWKRYLPVRGALIWLLVYYAVMALSKSFLFGWYFMPPIPLLLFLSVIGWVSMVARIPKFQLTIERKSVSSHVKIIFLLSGCFIPFIAIGMKSDQIAEAGLLRPIGEKLITVIPNGSTLMLEPIGYIGYFSHAKVIDAVGLVSPEVIPYFKKGTLSPYNDMLRGLKPEFVLLRKGELEELNRTISSPLSELVQNYQLEMEFGADGKADSKAPLFSLFRRK